MKHNFLQLYFEGFGNVNYQSPGTPAGAPVGANDGTAVIGGLVQLGQPTGTAGDPAALTADVEIPNAGGKTVYFGKNNGVAPVVAINSAHGISISNLTGEALLLNLIGHNYQFSAVGAGIFDFLFSPGDNLEYDQTLGGDLSYSNRFGAKALKANIQPVNFAASPYAVKRSDYTLLVDSSGGNVVINITPATMFDATNALGQFINIKKVSTDANTITINATAGLIIGVPPGAATFIISDPGANANLQSNGTNLYLL